MPFAAGLDLGSSSAKGILLDENGASVASVVLPARSLGDDPLSALIASLLGNRQADRLRVGITGAGLEQVRLPAGACRVNEVVALARGAAHARPSARSVIDVGAQSSRWLELERGGSDGRAEIRDFALNEKCAAGSGAFLEQQAGRLKLGLAEFSKLAAEARMKVKVAGRCSVFAQSDMIHLQQKGTPVGEIAYGLCLALVRNFMATALKGKDCPPPVLLTGGGALNDGLARAFEEILGLGPGGLVIAPEPLLTCALGAALVAASEAGADAPAGRASATGGMRAGAGDPQKRLPPLGSLPPSRAPEPCLTGDGLVQGYLGVDVGSVSTDLAVIDPHGEVLAGTYVSTAGKPIQALAEAYALLLSGFRGRLSILGIGTTGSGRYLAGRILEADVIHNEITCQMKSSLRYYPQADTVFEIGGQDSKYISLRGGRIRDFAMNKICAAGTGSFLEEQAALLGIDVRSDFARLAERSRAPHDLGSRCTVFMETELVSAAARGVALEDIVAGLAYSVARNYLEKVVAPRPVGANIVFQGGVASNAAVVQAFSTILGRTVRVHPYNRISGALGAALMAWEAFRPGTRAPRQAADLERIFERPYEISSFECRQCSNRCSVNRVAFEGRVAFFGDTCERYTSRETAPARTLEPRGPAPAPEKLPDLFIDRQELVEACLSPVGPGGPLIGLPRVSHMIEYLPFWASFFKALGCSVKVSPLSDMQLFEEGLKKLPAEICLPAKVAFGHLLSLREAGAERIFFPALLSLEKAGGAPTYPCPYGELLPAMARSALGLDFVSPRLAMHAGSKPVLRRLGEAVQKLGLDPDRVPEALEEASTALASFRIELRRRGREALEDAAAHGRVACAVLGRPYNLHDPFLNLNLARHMKKLGVTALPMDCLPLEPETLEGGDDLPVWKHSRLAIEGTRWTLGRPGVFPIILTNFGCGPDAFGLKHISKVLADKPHLVLEFDEHQAEAGLITRLEAFLDEVRSAREAHPSPVLIVRPEDSPDKAEVQDFRRRKVFVPYFADHAHAFTGAFRAVGIEAELLPPPDAETAALGEKHSSGKECHAFSLLVGDLIKLARSGRGEGALFFFPGSAHACLLQQYGTAMNLLLREQGLASLRVVSPVYDFTAKVLGLDGLKWLWRGMVAADLLIKQSCRVRPYELEPGLTDEVHGRNLADLELGLAGRDLAPALTRCVARLRSVPVRNETRPLVGVAGDIYTRNNGFANHGLFHKLEAMGCEVWPAPFFVDEADFSVGEALDSARRDLSLPLLAASTVLNLRKNFERDRVRRMLKFDNARFVEPGYEEALLNASPYLGRDNNSLVLLNVAKMVDYSKRGADGVLNVICFNCMLGTVAAALAERIRRDQSHIPLPTLVFSGTESVAERTRLEAFVHQVKRFAERRSDLERTSDPGPA